jgi:hypothetical protein
LPPLGGRQAVGADRPIADTIADKVSPGVTLIDPGYRKPFYLINNDKEVIGEFSGEYFSFMQLLPNGNILAVVWERVSTDQAITEPIASQYLQIAYLTIRPI